MCDVACLLLYTGTGVGRRVLLVRPARRAAWCQCRGVVGEGVGVVSGLVGRRGRAGLGSGGRAHGGQQLHGILKDMGQIECTGRLVGLAGTALGRLLRAGEGLLRGGAWTAHIDAASMERRRWGWQLKAVSGICGHGAAWLRRPDSHSLGEKVRLRAAAVAAKENGKREASDTSARTRKRTMMQRETVAIFVGGALSKRTSRLPPMLTC
jgi:hypothetical protein